MQIRCSYYVQKDMLRLKVFCQVGPPRLPGRTPWDSLEAGGRSAPPRARGATGPRASWGLRPQRGAAVGTGHAGTLVPLTWHEERDLLSLSSSPACSLQHPHSLGAP